MSHAITIVSNDKEAGFEISPELTPHEWTLLAKDDSSVFLVDLLHTEDSVTRCKELSVLAARKDAETIVRVLGKYGFYAEIVD